MMSMRNDSIRATSSSSAAQALAAARTTNASRRPLASVADPKMRAIMARVLKENKGLNEFLASR